MTEIPPEPPDPPSSSAIFMEEENAVHSLPIQHSESRKRPGIPNLQYTSPHKKIINNLDTATPSIQTVFTKPQEDQRLYDSTIDKGPFITHVSRTEPDPASGTSIRPIKMGQLLVRHNIKNITKNGVKSIGRNRVSIEFINAVSANSFLTHSFLPTNKLTAVIPTFNFSRMGLVRGIPVDWSMEDMISYIDLPDGCGEVLKARRLNRKILNNNVAEWIPTQTVVLTFRGQSLPDHIYAFHTSISVEPYLFPTIQCLNCCRFGHIKSQCRSTPRCFRCAQPHSGDGCSVAEAEANCLSCSGHHFSTSKSCPEQMRQRQIKIKMSQNNISYAEASSQTPVSKRSYSEVAKETPLPPHPPLQHQPHSYRKTVLIPKNPHSSSSHSVSHSLPHKNPLNLFPSELGNGVALHQPNISSNDNLIELLLSIIINMISKFSDSIPPNVAHLLSHLSTIIKPNNGPESPSTVEL